MYYIRLARIFQEILCINYDWSGMKHDDEIFQRIDDLLNLNHVQQKDLIEYLGLARGTYSNWARKKSTSYLSYIEEIAIFFGVNANYLITGRPDMSFAPLLLASTPQEERYLSCYRDSSENTKELLLNIVTLVTSWSQKTNS